MKLIINKRVFEINIEKNETSSAFEKMLPLKIEMQELNSNEKYCYLDKRLPSKSVQVKQINSGDIMLYGDNCIVIFYKSFSTTYTYTKIGSIKNPVDLSTILGKGSVALEFYAK